MQSRPGFRVSIVAAVLYLLAGSAYANDLSFTGNFTQDDQMQALAFTVASGANVTFETFGYAGGRTAPARLSLKVDSLPTFPYSIPAVI